MKLVTPFFVCFIVILQSCTGQVDKINGLSFVASKEPIGKEHVNPVRNINANYAAIMPFGFIRDLNNPNISFNSDKQWFGETTLGARQYIQELQKANIKIMLKPQIWVWQGEFTGNIKMTNETDWKELEQTYLLFILEYAQLAAEMNVEIFCIGTELEQFVVARPAYWNELIQKIKTIYKGKLTYAANWDEYKRTPFWPQLDFIGIDAYFPVSEEQTPTLATCLHGWEKHKQGIHSMSKVHGKPILFTEFGYRSVDYAGKAPWKSDRDMNQVNLNAQTNTTKALFDTFWNEEWFAGGFIWKWHHDYKKSGGKNNSRFTPQNKPVEELIKKKFSEY